MTRRPLGAGPVVAALAAITGFGGGVRGAACATPGISSVPNIEMAATTAARALFRTFVSPYETTRERGCELKGGTMPPMRTCGGDMAPPESPLHTKGSLYSEYADIGD
ncbi:hypothetical protein Sru01_29620 [Sphaerisporangium rufum]|uniref:Uncharacterized protein n=1 Tax=Sphaerisporangium rufum TaxID=1381558 RepID=A0A919R436_9ACTN|nr:hypothetical protein Sru01_29620 [Sphaerisporangium rufum]